MSGLGKTLAEPYRRLRRGAGMVRAYLRGRCRPGVHYLVEGGAWSIRHDGESIMAHLQRMAPRLACSVRTNPLGLYHQVVHFGSLWCFRGHLEEAHRSNRLVVTVFHGSDDMSPAAREAFRLLKRSVRRLDAVVTASRLMGGRLAGMGVPAEKLHVIPLGVDLDIFRPAPPEERRRQRADLGIPQDAVCIGSFQKDGVGWGEGLEPKLIKGPDIFVEAVRRLAARVPVFVLLTGPARGYVKRRLGEAGVPYRHDFLEEQAALAAYYGCLDLYLVTSREEGGPKAILEGMATGVPVVSTRVGMAPDVIEDGRNGLLVDIEDVQALVDGARRVQGDPELRRRIVAEGLRTAGGYGWPAIARRYYDEVYAPLLGRGR